MGVGRHLCGFCVQGRVTSSDLAGVQDAVETLASMQSGPGQCAVWTSTGKKTFQSFCPRWCSPLSFTPHPLNFIHNPPNILCACFLGCLMAFSSPPLCLITEGGSTGGKNN